jgi:hypothetical protein
MRSREHNHRARLTLLASLRREHHLKIARLILDIHLHIIGFNGFKSRLERAIIGIKGGGIVNQALIVVVEPFIVLFRLLVQHLDKLVHLLAVLLGVVQNGKESVKVIPEFRSPGLDGLGGKRLIRNPHDRLKSHILADSSVIGLPGHIISGPTGKILVLLGNRNLHNSLSFKCL